MWSTEGLFEGQLAHCYSCFGLLSLFLFFVTYSKTSFQLCHCFGDCNIQAFLDEHNFSQYGRNFFQSSNEIWNLETLESAAETWEISILFSFNAVNKLKFITIDYLRNPLVLLEYYFIRELRRRLVGVTQMLLLKGKHMNIELFSTEGEIYLPGYKKLIFSF